MSQKRIGALTIGQSPRPDLVESLAHILPGVEIIQAGALDDLTTVDLPDTEGVAYPLVTRMNDGTLVMVAENFIEPKLQTVLDRLETEEIAATLLMCAGTFAKLHGTQPLFKPFNIGKGILHSMRIESIGLIAPVPEQEAPIEQRWDAVGFRTTVWTADINNQDHYFQQQISERILQHNLECIVLDYFGHPAALVKQLQKSVDIPVLDLGYLAMSTLASTF